jgi:mannose-6-phosphate isomerase-like protein (cupin superfamily)
MARAGDIFEDAATGERTIVRKTGRETGGQADVVETFLLPGGCVPAPRVQEAQEQHLEVIYGRIAFEIGRETVFADSGDRIAIPAGTPHRYWNAGATEAQFVCESRPASTFDDTTTERETP